MWESSYNGSNPGSTDAAAVLLIEGFHTICIDEFMEDDSLFDQVFEIRPSDKRSEADFAMAGIGMAVQTDHGAGTEFEDPTSAGVKETTNLTYRKGIRLVEEDIEDDLYNVLTRFVKTLPKACKRRAESVAWTVMSSGFSTTVGFDGVSIYNAAHPYPGGATDIHGNSTQSNVLSVAGPPSPENFEEAWTGMRKQLDRKGFPIRARPTKIVVPPDLLSKAWEIQNSTNKAYSDENTANIHKEKWRAQILDVDWLATATEYHFVDTDQTPWFFYWRKKPQSRDDIQLNNFIRRFFIRMRCSADANEWRGSFGTPG